jgi:hypothetical protein
LIVATSCQHISSTRSSPYLAQSFRLVGWPYAMLAMASFKASDLASLSSKNMVITFLQGPGEGIRPQVSNSNGFSRYDIYQETQLTNERSAMGAWWRMCQGEGICLPFASYRPAGSPLVVPHGLWWVSALVAISSCIIGESLLPLTSPSLSSSTTRSCVVSPL